MMINPHLQKPPSSSTSLSPLPVTNTKDRILAISTEVEARSLMNTITSLGLKNEAVIVKAVVTVKLTAGSIFSNLFGITAPLDIFTDLLGRTFLLELVSAELDPKTGLEKKTIQGYAHKVSKVDDEVMYESSFSLPAGFGEVGAVLIENQHHEELYVKTIHLHINGFPDPSPVTVPCDSWAHSKHVNPNKRIFFTSKSYLPSATPSGLKRLRELELQYLRGNGQGERKTSMSHKTIKLN